MTGISHKQTLFLVIFPPGKNLTSPGRHTDIARQMLLRVFELAMTFHPNPCLIAWDTASDACYHLTKKKIIRFNSLFKKQKIVVAVTVGFLIQPVDVCRLFFNQTEDKPRRLYADISAGEILAAGFPVDQINQMSSRTVLQYMIGTCDTTGRSLPENLDHWHVFSPPVSIENSQSFNGAKSPGARPHPMSAIYLNTAYREILFAPVKIHLSTDGSVHQLVRCLSNLEKASQVPWIFNTLLNELEYISGKPTLTSFPPEVHMSISGTCSLECKFCSYMHSNSRPAYLNASHFKAGLPFARMHTLRLTSGLGEPTLNPHLAEIIHWISRTYPHIIINFFTNGLMLTAPGLIRAIVKNVRWINISLNAATAATWQHLCGRDLFGRLIENIKRLQTGKKSGNSLLPVLHGSMVINSRNVHELPKMPKLCHRLGIDKFTVIPFYSMNMHSSKKLNDANTLEHFRHQYDLLYENTVMAAKNYGISIELPRSSRWLSVRFGLEQRDFYDFCGIGEPLPYGIHHLLPAQLNSSQKLRHCPDLWRQLLISHTYRNLVGFNDFTHFRYPCLGPMCYSDYSVASGVNPQEPEELISLNNHPIFQFLRKSQFRPGINTVCDLCRGIDSRHPGTHEQFLDQLNNWQKRIMAGGN